MARQRLGIWIARLSAGALIVCASIAIAGYLGSEWFLGSAPPIQKPQPVRTRETSDTEHPLDPVLEMARSALDLHRSRDHDYSATLIKRQRLGSKLSDETRMELKLRTREGVTDSADDFTPRPIDVYLRFAAPKSQAGREVIWSQGKNDDLMTVHESGLLNIARVQLSPSSRLAMMGNRYPITDIGIERLLIKLIERGLLDRQMGDCTVTIMDDVEVVGRKCKRIEVVHPEPSVEVEGETRTFGYFRAVIDMDLEHGIPIHYASYLWPKKPKDPPLLDEEFTYDNLRLNCGLTELDFDPDNPKYQYPSR